jgi:phosphoserine phosphatase
VSALAAFSGERRRLLVMDVDSTFITGEQIDLLAAHAGSGERVAAITERAMRGELDFAASLHERVATLAGLPVAVLDEVRASVELTPGVVELLVAVTAAGWPVGLVSGGFHEIVDPLVADLPIARVRANRLEQADGRLTGRVLGDVVDRAAKAVFLREMAAEEEVDVADVVAIGDGANDLDMIAVAGLGVAFAAKPVVAAQADLALPGPRIDAVLPYLELPTSALPRG